MNSGNKKKNKQTKTKTKQKNKQKPSLIWALSLTQVLRSYSFNLSFYSRQLLFRSLPTTWRWVRNRHSKQKRGCRIASPLSKKNPTALCNYDTLIKSSHYLEFKGHRFCQESHWTLGKHSCIPAEHVAGVSKANTWQLIRENRIDLGWRLKSRYQAFGTSCWSSSPSLTKQDWAMEKRSWIPAHFAGVNTWVLKSLHAGERTKTMLYAAIFALHSAVSCIGRSDSLPENSTTLRRLHFNWYPHFCQNQRHGSPNQNERSLIGKIPLENLMSLGKCYPRHFSFSFSVPEKKENWRNKAVQGILDINWTEGQPESETTDSDFWKVVCSSDKRGVHRVIVNSPALETPRALSEAISWDNFDEGSPVIRDNFFNATKGQNGEAQLTPDMIRSQQNGAKGVSRMMIELNWLMGGHKNRIQSDPVSDHFHVRPQGSVSLKIDTRKRQHCSSQLFDKREPLRVTSKVKSFDYRLINFPNWLIFFGKLITQRKHRERHFKTKAAEKKPLNLGPWLTAAMEPLKDWELSRLAGEISPADFSRIAVRFLGLTKVKNIHVAQLSFGEKQQRHNGDSLYTKGKKSHWTRPTFDPLSDWIVTAVFAWFNRLLKEIARNIIRTVLFCVKTLFATIFPHCALDPADLVQK